MESMEEAYQRRGDVKFGDIVSRDTCDEYVDAEEILPEREWDLPWNGSPVKFVRL